LAGAASTVRVGWIRRKKKKKKKRTHGEIYTGNCGSIGVEKSAKAGWDLVRLPFVQEFFSTPEKTCFYPSSENLHRPTAAKGRLPDRPNGKGGLGLHSRPLVKRESFWWVELAPHPGWGETEPLISIGKRHRQGVELEGTCSKKTSPSSLSSFRRLELTTCTLYGRKKPRRRRQTTDGRKEGGRVKNLSVSE